MEDQGSQYEKYKHADAELLATKKRRILHDLRQPVSVIHIVIANIRRRCVPALDDELGSYLVGKLKQLDDQVNRLAEHIDEVDDLLQPGD